MNVNFVAACLITDANLRFAWEVAQVAAQKCNGGLDTLPGNEELHARSVARTETMWKAHAALEKLGLRLPNYNRTQAEVFCDFKAGWGEDPYNGFCWEVARTALKEREMYKLEQEAEWAEYCHQKESAALEQANSFKRVHA
jgi:hypothetical protein